MNMLFLLQTFLYEFIDSSLVAGKNILMIIIALYLQDQYTGEYCSSPFEGQQQQQFSSKQSNSGSSSGSSSCSSRVVVESVVEQCKSVVVQCIVVQSGVEKRSLVQCSVQFNVVVEQCSLVQCIVQCSEVKCSVV